MRLTRQTNYAIRILMYCAANDGRLSRIPEIAAAYSVSELFLFKIMQPKGAVPTLELDNGERLTEESFAMAECFENDSADCPLIDSCNLNAALRKALGAFFEVLESYTIADLVKDRVDMRLRLGLGEIAMARAS